MILQNKNVLVKTIKNAIYSYILQNAIHFSRSKVVFSSVKLRFVGMLQRVYFQEPYVLFFNLD